MAVPSSGTLSWGSIAMERLQNSYVPYISASYGANVPVFNIFKGGSTGGGATAGSTYPALATASPGNSNINTRALAGTNFSASMWYNYDQGAQSVCTRECMQARAYAYVAAHTQACNP